MKSNSGTDSLELKQKRVSGDSDPGQVNKDLSIDPFWIDAGCPRNTALLQGPEHLFRNSWFN